MNKIWKNDHGDFEPSDDADLRFVYKNQNIEQYLNSSSTNYFLVGRKGVGKSLMIKYKSYLFRNRTYKDKGVHFIPKQQLVEKISIDLNTLSKKDLLTFSKVSIWKSIWKFTIMYMVCRAAGVPIDKEIKQSVEGMDNISSILGLVLLNRGKIGKYALYNIKLLNLTKKIQNGVVVFIDNFDQVFEEVLLDNHYTDELNPVGKSPAVKFWINAQNALMSAIYEINQSNSHVKIFTTIRQEAFNEYKGAMKQNLRSYSSFLDYSKIEIKEIFLNRLKELKRLRTISNSELIKRFIGFDKMEHPLAKDEEGNYRVENVFDFLYRHTYGRPREILIFGKRLEELVDEHEFNELPLEDKVFKIRLAINEDSHKILFNDYNSRFAEKSA